MFRLCLPLALLLALLVATTVDAKPNLEGTWVIKAPGYSYSGNMVLHQSGSGVNGIWHSVSNNEVDTTVAGLIEGDTLTLVRSAGGQQQKFMITLSKDGNHAEGYGDGVGLKHAVMSFDRTDTKPNDAALKVPRQAAPPSPSQVQAEFSGLMTLVGFVLFIVLANIGIEFFMALQSGWRSLASRYPCNDFMTSLDSCWWLSMVRPGRSWSTNVQYGKGKVSFLPKLGIPPFRIGASSQGLILKRNLWNIAHPPMMIPWNQIVSAREVNWVDVGMCRGRALAAGALIGKVCEITVADPSIAIYIQMEAAASIRRFLGTAFKSKDGR